MTSTTQDAQRSAPRSASGGYQDTGRGARVLQGQNGVPIQGTSPADSYEEYKPKRDPEFFGGGVRRSIKAFGKIAAENDPWVMHNVLALQADIERAAATALRAYLAAGVTWAEIGFGAGPDGTNLNRTQAWKKFKPLLDAYPEEGSA